MLPVLALVIATASPPLTIAAPEFQTVHSEPEVAAFALDQLAQRLGTRGIHLVTPREMSTLLGMERQKQLLQCGDDSTSCTMELGNALGASSVLTGSLVKLGDVTQLGLRVLSAKDGAQLAQVTRRVKDDSQLLDAIDSAADELADLLLPKPAAPVAIAQAQPPAPAPARHRYARTWALVPAGIAAAALTVSAVELSRASSVHGQLVAETGAPIVAPADAALVEDGESAQNAARIGLAVGAGALVATAIVYYFAGPPEAVNVAFGPTSSGAAVVLSGSFR